MARQISPGAVVTGLTSSALVAVLALAVQAGESIPENTASKKTVSPSPSGSAGKGKDGKGGPAKPPAIPADSGQGKRVVYSLGQDRAWLVNDAGKATATFAVWPGTKDPAPGSHKVTFRKPSGTGSDGVPVERIIYFANSGGVTIAFSAATDGSSPKPIIGKETGAVRMKTEDSKSLWDFTVSGSTIVVVG
ncbi:L,D-transpeptidase [Streptomyces sp. CAU 1734]|uniref:L,D-transpeptidase n=1 Tax=Streptomyces sp. CAU 1734 TaxID=3140360 RepID=UPI003261D307